MILFFKKFPPHRHTSDLTNPGRAIQLRPGKASFPTYLMGTDTWTEFGEHLLPSEKYNMEKNVSCYIASA